MPHARILALAPVSLALLGALGCFTGKSNDDDAGDDLATETAETEDSDTTDDDTTTESDTNTDEPETTTDDSTDDATTGPCTQEGCECDASEGSCDPSLVCIDNVCVSPVCGNGTPEGTEQCDDGNDVDGDGCDADCSFTEILYVDPSYQNTCVLIEGGRVRCWGANYVGQLGYGHTDDIGDNETPADVGDVMLPEPGVELTMGDSHTCVLLADSAVRCWGQGSCGKLGYGNVNNIGDDEFPVSIIDVPIGGAALEVDAGGSQTCARLNDGKMRCWGCGSGGQLGYANANNIGDDEPPANAGDVPVGGAVIAQSTGIGHTCAILANGAIRCWGQGFDGRLGYGNTNSIGDNETPAAAGNVPAIPLGLPPTTKATALALGLNMSCALFDTGDVLCWGSNFGGQLGQGNTTTIGDDEFPATLAPIDLGAPAVSISAGDTHVCALLETDEVICWGSNTSGQLGRGNTLPIGDDETPASLGPIDLGAPVKQIDAGGNHTCAVLMNNQVRCWGINGDGELGLGNTNNVGDDELPTAVEPVQIF